jgi:hypothetical protein
MLHRHETFSMEDNDAPDFHWGLESVTKSSDEEDDEEYANEGKEDDDRTGSLRNPDLMRLYRMPAQRQLQDIPRVMFCSLEDIQDVEEPEDEELKERWYSEDEYSLFKTDYMNMLVQSDSPDGGPTDGSLMSGMDIDLASSPVAKSFMDRRRQVKDSVRTVLETQRNSSDPHLSFGLPKSALENDLAMKYRYVTTRAVQGAVKRAVQYQVEADEYLQDMRPRKDEKKTPRQPEKPKQSLVSLFGSRWGF